MPSAFNKQVFLIAIFFCLSNHMKSQISGGSVFLQGCYVELAISECGVYGTDDGVPSSGPFGDYHPNVPGWFGFVADHEKDGWDMGSPDYCGDYFVPGSPVEGWQVQYESDVYTNSDVGCYYNDIDGSVVSYVDTGGFKSAVWVGSIDDIELDITQQTIFPDGALFFLTSVTLCNTGATDLTQ